MCISEYDLEISSSKDFSSYGVAYKLYQQTKRYNSSTLANSYIEFASDLEKVFSYYQNEKNNPDYQGPVATIELQAIVFRLSRQHMEKAKTIENIANYFLAYVQYKLETYETVKLTIKNAEYIDRPSLMILNRLMNLTNTEFKERLKIVLEIDYLSIEKMSGQLKVYRQDLFNAVKNNLDIEYNQEDSLSSSVLDIQRSDLAVLNAALLEQNYELAYIISLKELRLDKALRFAHTSLYHRYLGVVAANLGYYDQAIMHFNDAIKRSSNSMEYYRNIYIKSICYIKRKDDPDFAIKNLEKALTEIKNSEERSNLKFEEGWITNGLCLGETIRALKLPNIEKEKEIEKVFKKEMEVYKIISKEVEYKYIYLKYNILANMAFLLEINKDYKNAIRFWERAFSPMLNSKSIDAEKTLSYRLGIIHIKIGDFEAAQNYLKRSLELSRIEKNSFDSIIILYGLAYNSLSKNNFSLSEKYIQEGLELSKKIGDCSNNKRFLSLKEYFKKEVKKEELSPEFPSIKLRSYVDFLDLTFKPQRDINKELIRMRVENEIYRY
ncbi:MAG: hypothetical protein ACFWTY_12410 [Shouchella clausii]|jgi:tetratricopeptide (TPR) repeat protein